MASPAPAKREPGAILGTQRSAVQGEPDPDFDAVQPILSASAVAKARRDTREKRARSEELHSALATTARRVAVRRAAMPETKVVAASGWDQAGVRLAVLPPASEDQKLWVFYFDCVDDSAVLPADQVRDMERELRACGYEHVVQDNIQETQGRLRLDIHNPTLTDHTNLCVLAEHAAFKICEMFRIVSKRAYGAHPLRFDTPEWLARNENLVQHGLRRSHYEMGGGIFACGEDVGEWYDDNDYGVDPPDTAITYDSEDKEQQFPMYHLRKTPVGFAFVDGARGDNGGGEWARLMAHWTAFMVDALEASASEPKDNPLGPHQGDERAVGRKLRRDVAPPTDPRFGSFLNAVERLMRQPGRRSVALLNEKTRELWAKHVVGTG